MGTDMGDISCTASDLQMDFPPLGMLSVAAWNYEGGFRRFALPAKDALRLFFDAPAPNVPRPGNWYCNRCSLRNTSTRFYCRRCPDFYKVANVSTGIRVPCGNLYPRRGDWGCGSCGEALCRFHKECTYCRTLRSADCNFIVP